MRGIGTNYPDSFTSVRGFLIFGERELLDAFNAYYSKRFISGIDLQTWKYRAEGLRAAKILFGDFTQWLYGQLEGEFLYGQRLLFLEDTLRFITMGTRSVSINNWVDLLEDYPETNVLIDRQGSERRLKAAFPNPMHTVDVIIAWCKQPSGFEDLIITLNILFGDAKP
jgi:hypothetical protein